MLDLPRPVDPLVRIIDKPTVARRVHERLKTDRGHRDEQDSDDEKSDKKLGMNRGTGDSDPAHHTAERRSAQRCRSELFKSDFRALPRMPAHRRDHVCGEAAGNYVYCARRREN
jgi:hypothetical protein